MSKYKMAPPKAWMKVNGEMAGYPDQPCVSCGEPVCWYSEAGKREVFMSGMCEPCFDFVTWPNDEESPEWMSLVEYSDEYVNGKEG